MPTLHVRNVPDDLYAEIRRFAAAENRSLGAQVVIMLTRALEQEKRHKIQAKALTSIRHRRFIAPPEAPPSSELLREDRNR